MEIEISCRTCGGGALGSVPGGEEGSRIRREEELGCDAVTIRPAANPRGALELGGSCTVVLPGGQGSGTSQSKDVVVLGQRV